MELTVVPVVKPDAANFIFGQSHFIKTVEDLHEALVGAVPNIRFGLAFCEASGKRLVRWSGNDEAALALARDNALAIGAGHTFLIFLGDGFFPVNVLAAVRAVPEVCRIYCATANPTQVIVAQTELGRGVLGVVDGASPLGVETDADIAWRVASACAYSGECHDGGTPKRPQRRRSGVLRAPINPTLPGA